MNFLLVADARKAEPPIPPQPSGTVALDLSKMRVPTGRGFSSWFQAGPSPLESEAPAWKRQAHSQSLSLTGLAVVLASGAGET